ncbi:MAG: hypothetical protein WBP81_07220 [Solirubrobacteraceae bacterium]
MPTEHGTPKHLVAPSLEAAGRLARAATALVGWFLLAAWLTAAVQTPVARAASPLSLVNPPGTGGIVSLIFVRQGGQPAAISHLRGALAVVVANSGTEALQLRLEYARKSALAIEDLPGAGGIAQLVPPKLSDRDIVTLRADLQAAARAPASAARTPSPKPSVRLW